MLCVLDARAVIVTQQVIVRTVRSVGLPLRSLHTDNVGPSCIVCNRLVNYLTKIYLVPIAHPYAYTGVRCRLRARSGVTARLAR